MWFSKCTTKQKCCLYLNVFGCGPLGNTLFWGLVGFHPHGNSGKTIGLVAPAYLHPPFAAAYGTTDNSASVPAASFELYPRSLIYRQRLCGDFGVRATAVDHHTSLVLNRYHTCWPQGDETGVPKYALVIPVLCVLSFWVYPTPHKNAQRLRFHPQNMFPLKCSLSYFSERSLNACSPCLTA